MLDGIQRPSTNCLFCTGSLPIVQQDIADPFSLSNLLPAGVIPVNVHECGPPCPSTCNSHEWYSLPALEYPKGSLFGRLAFLTRNLFLRATCRLGASGRIIFLRLYLIPNDLPNVGGRLHLRSETILNQSECCMRHIVPLIEQHGGLWDADEACLDAPQKYFFPSSIDNRSMAEIYSDLPSPMLNPLTNEDSRIPHHIVSGGAIWGLRTALYGYQRHSVAVMLDRESSTDPVPDSSYIGILCLSGIFCFIQPSTMTVMRQCPTFSPCRGGMLCEELGMGKTIMIISLALVTAKWLPDPEESLVEQPILTPLSYNYFPSAEYALARKKAGLGSRTVQQVPSLVELLVDYFSSLKVITGRPAFADELEASHLWSFVQANVPFYHHYQEASKRPCRLRKPNLPPRTMYLSAATLVIVPGSLLGQWKSEIDRHCHDYVRYLVAYSEMVLPCARKLASEYELIIISDARIRTESAKKKTGKLCELVPCACPYLAGSRLPDCHCPGDNVSPLLQIRWKRLVVDEGHNTSNSATVTNDFIRRLSVQHKWVVTGTPTSNILGLQSGRSIDDLDPFDCNEHEPDLDHPVTSLSLLFLSITFGFSVLTSRSQPDDDSSGVRIWGDYDRKNLVKLRVMIRDFLAVPQFQLKESFSKNVTKPLYLQDGPRPGAIKVLTQVMQMVMVRHRIEDVENDVLLPPMKHDIVYMDLDRYALRSYNAMQAGLVVNAIDSEREGLDYLFHPSVRYSLLTKCEPESTLKFTDIYPEQNAKNLQAAIGNSLQGLFWSNSSDLYNVESICHYADKYLDTAVKRGKGPEELDLLQQAIKHAAAAANDKIWRAMQPLHLGIPFNVSGLDPDVFEAWTRAGFLDSSRTADLMHPDRLANLRLLLRLKPLLSIDDLIEEGNELNDTEDGKMAPITGSHSDSGEKHPANQVQVTKLKEVRGVIEGSKKRIKQRHALNMDEFVRQEVDKITPSLNKGAAACVSRSPHLSGVKVGPSLSTKLNYILSEIQRYSAQEKFLIFSNSPLTLFQIGEALSLFEIKFLRYTTEEKGPVRREKCLLTFETSDHHRVLLVSLKLGARGLNIISASRIIFCEPVWHPDVESQAIKRCHRIGQMRPVTVKTLAIRSTAEEAMIVRRQYLRSGDKVPNMITEDGMRQYLQHPRFLSESTSRDLNDVVFSLDDGQVASVDLNLNSSGVDVDSTILVHDSDSDHDEDMPAHKRVRIEE